MQRTQQRPGLHCPRRPPPLRSGKPFQHLNNFFACISGFLVLPTIHKAKVGEKLGDTFGLMDTLIYPLDLSQNSTAILHADSLAACPE